VHVRKKMTFAQGLRTAFQSRSLAEERRHEIQRDTKLIQGSGQRTEVLERQH
jgi:hypothetical protein